jgi:hypothetical protein
MHRALLIPLGLICLAGCESSGSNSLAAFGPNTVPPAVRQPGSDPYYSAGSNSDRTSPPDTLAGSATTGTSDLDPARAATRESPPPAIAPRSTIPGTMAGNSGSTPSNEPPIRIVEREGALPATGRPSAETSRLPATQAPAPSPLQRTGITPRLQPIPSSAFGKKAPSGSVVPASYERPAGVTPTAESLWRAR